MGRYRWLILAAGRSGDDTVLGVAGIVIPIAFAAVVAGASWQLAFFASAACALAGAALLRPLVQL